MVAVARKPRSLQKPSSGPATGSLVVSADGRRIPGDALDRLEQLDDAIFEALSGDPAALDRLATLWSEAQRKIEPRLLDETRDHYVRRAESRFRKSQRTGGERLTLGFAALEILGLLAD